MGTAGLPSEGGQVVSGARGGEERGGRVSDTDQVSPPAADSHRMALGLTAAESPPSRGLAVPGSGI